MSIFVVMDDLFVDRVVVKLLETYTTDDMDMTIDSLKDTPYQQLMMSLKSSYGIRKYGRRSSIRKTLEEILIIRFWEELEDKLLNEG